MKKVWRYLDHLTEVELEELRMLDEIIKWLDDRRTYHCAKRTLIVNRGVGRAKYRASAERRNAA